MFPNFIVGGPGARSTVTLRNNRVRCPDPSCRGWARLPDGEFSLIDDTLTLLRDATAEELARLRAILRSGRSPEQVIQQVQEEVPRLADVVRTPSGFRLTPEFWLSTLLTLLALVAGPAVEDMIYEPPPSIEQIKDSFRDELERVRQANPPASTPTVPSQIRSSEGPSKPPPRNSPCHCGSGTKYKKCHGSPANR